MLLVVGLRKVGERVYVVLGSVKESNVRVCFFGVVEVGGEDRNQKLY